MGAKTKAEAMDDLFARAVEKARGICRPGVCLVWGEGSLDAPIVFVGEAPGEQETRLRRPFVGQAGKLFGAELEHAGIDRSQCWITNLVKCRPTAISRSGVAINRPPERAEIANWLPFLTEELEIIRPDVIVCLGAAAAKSLISVDFAITRQRGNWFDGPSGARMIATFHPSYINRTPTARQLFRKDLTEAKRVSEAQP